MIILLNCWTLQITEIHEKGWFTKPLFLMPKQYKIKSPADV